MSERRERSWGVCYSAPWVLPVSAPPIREGAVVVEGGAIAWVGARAALPDELRVRHERLERIALTPGLVNAHAHLDLTILRGVLDGLPFFDWIRAVVAARDEVGDSDWRASATAGAVEAVRAGITTVGDTAPTLASLDALVACGLRGIAYLETFGPHPDMAAGALEELAQRVAAARGRETPLVRVGVSPHAPYSTSEALYRGVSEYAARENLRLATHVAESADETAFVTRGEGPFGAMFARRSLPLPAPALSPVAFLERTGTLALRPLLIHAVRCDAADTAAIASAQATIATCPHSNAWFGHGRAPVGAYEAAGIAVGVGSDSLASNDAMDMRRESSAAGGTPEQVLARATLGGARALQLDAAIGTLEPGKRADLAGFGLSDAAAAAGAPPWHELLGAPPRWTVVDGNVLMRGGALAGVAAALAPQAEAAAAAANRRLREWRARVTPA